MVIYLKHPVHGSKVAISDAEAEYDKTRGWVIYDPEAGLPAAPKKPSVNMLVPPSAPVVPVVTAPDWLAPQSVTENPKPKGRGGRPKSVK